MFTVCPKCSLKLVVTAADLRVAQGHVRCGRCSNVFNALVGLSDDAHAELSREERSAAPERLEASNPQRSEPPNPQAATTNDQLEPTSSRPRARRETSEAPTAHAEEPGPGARESGSGEPAPSESDEAPTPEGALEFDASSTDISEVFIEASPDDLGTTGQSETILLSSEEEPAQNSDEGSDDAAREIADRSSDEADEDHGTEPSCGESDDLDEAFADPPSGEAPAFDETFTDPSSSESVAVDEAGEADDGDDAADQLSGEAGDARELDRRPDESLEHSHPLEAEHLLEETDEFRLADLEFLLESSVAGERASVEPTNGAQTDEAGSAAADAHDAGAEGAARSTPAATAQASSTAEPQPGPPPQAADEAPLGEFAPARPRSRGGWKFAAGTAVLALALAAQVVNHYRARLVEIPSLHRPLTTIYAALGKPLSPHWNVKAYAVRQLGAIVRPGSPGALSVRASIENTAPRAQPLPLLRVIVQDRFGNRVAARDVRPGAYLPGKRAKVGLLGPGKRVDAEIAFVDPGPRVVGFEIDACLESEAGRITCAHEPGARAP